jgi:putative flippase GtrA
MKLLTMLETRLGRLPRFLVAGGGATLIHWLTMWALVQTGVDARLATSIGAGVGLLVNYLAQHRFTFESNLAHGVAFPRYLAGAALGWVLNLVAFSALIGAGAGIVWSQGIATAVVALANFLFAQRFVFHEAPDETPE